MPSSSRWEGSKNSIISEVTGKKLGFSKVAILSNIILIKVLFPFLVKPQSKIFIVTVGTSSIILKKLASGVFDKIKGFWFNTKVVSHK